MPDVTVEQQFAEWLKRQLRQRGWSQAELARRSGLSPSRISDMIHARQAPGRRSIGRIAQVFNMDPEELAIIVGYFGTDPDRDEYENASGLAREMHSLIDAIEWTPEMAEQVLAVLRVIHAQQESGIAVR